MNLLDVNLVWSRRFRGLLPLAVNAIDTTGRLTLVRPDELEARVYQVMSVSLDKPPEVRSSLSVETIYKMEVASAGATLIGVTDDDLYLFHEDRKTRFLPGRRVAYNDMALARDGQFFAVAFSDIMFASHTAALCEMTGRTAWTKDLDFAVACLALTPDGRLLVVGGEKGAVVAFDAGRTVLWEAFLDVPEGASDQVSALALAADRGDCLVGTTTGSVVALDRGSLMWSAELRLPVVALAVSDAADVVAVAAGDAAASALIMLDRHGMPAWEYDLEARPTGVALSPDGSRLAVSTADGGLLLFEFPSTGSTPGEAPAHESALEAVTDQWVAGERSEARARLAELLQCAPGNVTACDLLSEWDEPLLTEALAEAGRLADDGDFAGALAQLDTAHALDPTDVRVPASRGTIEELAVTTLRQQGVARLADGDVDGALETWRSLLTLCPKDRETHTAIAAVREQRVAELVRRGEERAAAGDCDGAVEYWRQAQALLPDSETAARLREAEIEQALALGKRFYQERRYPEAAFQFRKVLALVPEHEEAQRFLGYAQNMRPGSPMSDRFRHLE
jgi:tetratricopeptide (TPR) repeat protein